MRTIVKLIVLIAIFVFVAPGVRAQTNTFPSDPLLDLLIKKGYISTDEATKVRAEAVAIANGTNDNSVSKIALCTRRMVHVSSWIDSATLRESVCVPIWSAIFILVCGSKQHPIHA